ncbi:MAG TPA: nitroreductase [Kiritimatiellae bacterium]|nr:nitroreductase [Kiritimatiellia bacterium]
MGAFLDLVHRRRSVRRYARRPVPRDVIDRCVEAARLAPSACNSQPWRFLIFDRDPWRSRVAQAAFGGVYSLFSFARQAPVLVALVRLQSTYAAKLGGLMRRVNYSLIDIGIAGEHFVLQAAEEGVGTCWIGWFNERRVRRILRLAPGERLDVLIAMGYPQEDAPERVGERSRKPLEQVREYR